MLDLVGNPEDRFPRVAAHIKVSVKLKKGRVQVPALLCSRTLSNSNKNRDLEDARFGVLGQENSCSDA